MEKIGFVYIITNKYNNVFYVGVTSELFNRIYEHRNKLYPNSFSAKYNLYKLVYYEAFEDMENAIRREKQLKAGSRKKKIDLIRSVNPDWLELDAGQVENEVFRNWGRPTPV